MSQEQPRRPQEPIKYGDVFPVSGDLASQQIVPQDAAIMQTAETTVIGKTLKGGPAATMQSAADRNERAGLVGHTDITDAAGEQGVTVTETDLPGTRVITESVAGQVVGQIVEPRPVKVAGEQTVIGGGVVQSAVTIGEALEATARTAGDKPVEQSDAAAIQAAEVRATGINELTPGGVSAVAQSAASLNADIIYEDDKIKLAEVLTGATTKLPADKVVTRADAEGVMCAELRNNPNLSAHPGGVADTVAAAAKLNERSAP